MEKRPKLLQAVLDKTVDGKKVFGTTFAVQQGSYHWLGAAGDMSADQAYFIASTTKLFTTALILHLRAAGKLNLEDKITAYLDSAILKGLHRYRGTDYSRTLSLKHLLAHTSGLADYFQNKGDNGRSLEQEIVAGNDQHWTFEQALARTKAMQPRFAPGTKKKAHYSDTNFQLLGRIIENITDTSYAANCAEKIIQPLQLSATYLYQDHRDQQPKPLYYQSNELRIPRAMTSFGPDGGMVSSSADMLRFTEAFFTGKLFPAAYIDDLQVWNRIFFPMRSGIGIHLFRLPWLFNPIRTVPDFIGHSGLSGALAFYSPKENLYLAGTVNQVAHPDISFRTMIRLTQVLKKS
jgi:D-alanyl-D-alanine carboxypeptidase